MSKQSFERKVALWAKETPGLWSYHPPDTPMGKQFVPGDFIYGTDGNWGVIECKSTESNRFLWSEWTLNQRRQCAKALAGGGHYWVFVQYEKLGLAVAVHGRDALELAENMAALHPVESSFALHLDKATFSGFVR